MSEAPFLGPAWARNTTCCGKPFGCTNMSGQCRMLNHTWKRWHRETYGPPDPDTADDDGSGEIEPGTPSVLLSVHRRLLRGTSSCCA